MIKLPILNSQTDAQSATLHHYTDATAPRPAEPESGPAPAPAPAQPPPPIPVTAADGEDENSQPALVAPARRAEATRRRKHPSEGGSPSVIADQPAICSLHPATLSAVDRQPATFNFQPATLSLVDREPAPLSPTFSTLDARRSTLDLIAPPVSSTQAIAMIDAKPLLPSAPSAVPLAPCDSRPAPASDVSTSDLQNLLNQGSFRVKEERALIHRRTVEPASQPATCNLQPATPNSYECVISAPPTASTCLAQRIRNGKIARLPKLERDLVNKLLHNHAPYAKIVWALGERGITVTERNISNWRTRGGYKEWCAEQENQLRLAHLQDHLTDYLRKHDAQQLPEVGLQVASTQLTSLLMNPQTAAPLLADPNKYAKIIESLDKCSVRLNELQKDRYETVRRAGIRDTLPNLRREAEKDVEVLREIASAEKLGASAYEDDIPHRNDLPPREEMPYRQPGPTIGEMLGQLKGLAGKPKQPANAPSNVAQPAVPGNRTVT